MARASTNAANKHKAVFHEEEVPLFFYDGEVSLEDELPFMNEEVIQLNEEEHDIHEEHDISYGNFDLLWVKSMILLVLHRLFIICSKLNETISRNFQQWRNSFKVI